MNFLDHDEVEWGDIRVDIAGGRLIKLTGIKFSTEVEKELLFAEGDKPRGTQSGNRSYAIEITMLVGALIDLNLEAMAAGGKDVLDLKVPVVLRFRSKGVRPMRLWRFVNVSFSKYEVSMVQGDKKAEITLPGVFEDFVMVTA